MAQQREGHAVGHFLFGEFAFGIGDIGVLLVDEMQEAHAAALVVVEHDVAVVGIHQRADHRVDAAEHLRHFQVGAGQVGDLVQRLLQALGFFQRHDARLRARGIQRGRHQGLGQRQPGLGLGAGPAAAAVTPPRQCARCHRRCPRRGPAARLRSVLGIRVGQRCSAHACAGRTCPRGQARRRCPAPSRASRPPAEHPSGSRPRRIDHDAIGGRHRGRRTARVGGTGEPASGRATSAASM